MFQKLFYFAMIRKNIPYIVEGIFEKHINKYKK